MAATCLRKSDVGICRLTPVAGILQGLAEISNGLLVARFTVKLCEMPPDRITSRNAHRDADLQTLHGGKKLVHINALRRLRCSERTRDAAQHQRCAIGRTTIAPSAFHDSPPSLRVVFSTTWLIRCGPAPRSSRAF